MTGTDTDAQLDILELLDELDPPPPPRMPARIFGYRGRTVGDYQRRFEQWCADSPDGHFNSLMLSHGWVHNGMTNPITGQCDPTLLSADLRCLHAKYGRCDTCECVGAELVHRTVCDHCGWHSIVVAGDQTRVIVAGLDHAYPGWRDGPLAPARPNGSTATLKRWEKKVRALYGERRWGWPVITDRHPPEVGSVKGYSPWGGYDVAAVIVAKYPQQQV